jgi:hypothetical protein
MEAQHMTDQRREPQDKTGPERPTTRSRAPRTAFGRAYQRNASLLPEKASVKAFVAWMRDLGFSGEQLLSDLYLEFSETVELMGGSPLPLKRFGRALAKAGYTPYQADKEKDGKRWRPMAVNLSAIKPELAAIGSNVSRIVTSATTAKRLPTSGRSVPWPELPMRKAA